VPTLGDQSFKFELNTCQSRYDGVSACSLGREALNNRYYVNPGRKYCIVFKEYTELKSLKNMPPILRKKNGVLKIAYFSPVTPNLYSNKRLMRSWWKCEVQKCCFLNVEHAIMKL